MNAIKCLVELLDMAIIDFLAILLVYIIIIA